MNLEDIAKHCDSMPPKKIQYEIWAADYFDYKDVEWSCYVIYTDKEQAKTALQELRREAGGERGIVRFRLQKREVRESL